MTRSPLFSRAEWIGLSALTAVLLAVRLPYLPLALEDIDSVNFHLGVHDFYPFAHQPHPPGYAVFILLAKLLHPLSANHAAALALPSVLCSALVIWPLYVLLRVLVGATAAGLGVVLVAANPVFWMNSVRPMSDVTGLFVVLAAQSALVVALVDAGRATSQRRLWLLGAAISGLAIGVRPQAVMLVGPILLVGWLRLPRLRLSTAAVVAASIAAWLVPTIVQTGGLRRLLSKQNQLIAEALPLEPLLSRLSFSQAIEALVDVFLRPWGELWLGAAVVGMAAIGAGILARRNRQALSVLVVLFVPYLVYHYFLQWTPALRYVLPVLPLVVALAAAGVTAVRSPVPALVAGALTIAAAVSVSVPALQAYSNQPSPPMKAIAYLRSQAAADSPLVASGHDVFHRYLAELSGVAKIVQTEPGIEWHGLNRYWAYGGDRTVWFLGDPTRSTLQLVDPEAQTQIVSWRWPAPLARLTQGARPMHVQLVRIDPPKWFIESGAFLVGDAATPERLARGPHLLFVRAATATQALSIFGVAPGATTIDVVVGGERQVFAVGPQSFGITATVPAASGPALEYVPVTLESRAPFQVTGFSMRPPDEDSFEPAAGFFSPERDETGEFHWVGPRGEVAIARSGPPVRLRLRGWIPEAFVTMPLQIAIAANGKPIRTDTITSADFTLAVDLPAAPPNSTTLVSLEASSSFVPDSFERNGDRRVLVFRAYELHAERLDGARTPSR